MSTHQQFIYRTILAIIFFTSILTLGMNFYFHNKIKAIHQEKNEKIQIEKQKQLQILLNLKEIKPTV